MPESTHDCLNHRCLWRPFFLLFGDKASSSGADLSNGDSRQRSSCKTANSHLSLRPSHPIPITRL